MEADLRGGAAYVEGLLQGLRARPRDADLWTNVADMLLEAARFETAVRAYDLALDLDPKLHRARLGLTIALDLCDRDMSAREPAEMRSVAWEVLQALDTLLRGLKDGGRSPFVDVHALRIQKETRRRLARNPSDADAMFLQSALLAKEGAFEEAVAILDNLAATGVEYPGAREFRNQLRAMIAPAPAERTRPES